LVSGHVDGIGEVLSREEEARSWRFVLRAPGELKRFVARKGSICIDGVSLTVNGVDDDRFDVNIVPHTLAMTTIGDWRPGTRVNLEVDVVARYLERLLAAGRPGGGITSAMLEEYGFAKGH
jgi:riboflavin synthase